MDKDGFILLENYIELRNENKDIENSINIDLDRNSSEFISQASSMRAEDIENINSPSSQDSKYKILDALFEELYDEKISKKSLTKTSFRSS